MEVLDGTKSGVVVFEARDQIAILTIDNGIQNKISQGEFLELTALKKWLSEGDFKGLVIQGRGRHFSAGADVNNIKANLHRLDYLRESLRKGKEILDYIEGLPIITVAAISGACFGAGLEIALSCHFRVCTANGILALPESNLGILPGLGGTLRLAERIGRQKALEVILTGKTITPEEALALGLIDRLVPNKSHLESAIEMINGVTQNKSLGQIHRIVKAVNNGVNENRAQALSQEENMFMELVINLKNEEETS